MTTVLDRAVPRVQKERGRRLKPCLLLFPTPRQRFRRLLSPGSDTNLQTRITVSRGHRVLTGAGRKPRPPAGVFRHFRCRATPPRLPGRGGRRPRRAPSCPPGSSLWSQLARQAARRQEAVSEWGPLPRQDVSGLGRRRRGAPVQLGGAVQARWRPGSDPRPQPGMEEFNDF